MLETFDSPSVDWSETGTLEILAKETIDLSPICGGPVVKESCGLAVQQLQVCARLVPAVRLRAIDMRPLRATLPQRSPVMAFPSPVGWWTDPRFTLPVTFESGIGHLERPHNPVSHRIKEGKITEGVPR